MEKINLDLLIKHLGQPERKVYNEYIWQCPMCQDTHRDNLKFNIEKGVLYCFANSNHAREILSNIIKSDDKKIPSKE